VVCPGHVACRMGDVAAASLKAFSTQPLNILVHPQEPREQKHSQIYRRGRKGRRGRNFEKR
jgi:hypothetical protein